jgi:uncharacterized membrane protein YraQ (UPF0718 family)
MLETVVTIILIPFAIGAVVITGAIIAGVIKYFNKKK